MPCYIVPGYPVLPFRCHAITYSTLYNYHHIIACWCCACWTTGDQVVVGVRRLVSVDMTAMMMNHCGYIFITIVECMVTVFEVRMVKIMMRKSYNMLRLWWVTGEWHCGCNNDDKSAVTNLWLWLHNQRWVHYDVNMTSCWQPMVMVV